MKMNEFRLGNLVFCNGNVSSITGLSSEYNLVRVLNDLGGINTSITELSPIPLFRSFFETNGFIEEDNYGFPVLSNSELRMTVYETGKGWHIHIDDQDYCTSFLGTVENLHTLQNIYFFATGKELEFKLCQV